MTDPQARVAVLVPCFEDGRFVGETVASVQEEEPFELVVVDDASRDPHTLDVLARMESEGIRLRRHPENRGVGAARNTGLEATRAPYVFPLDADDLTVPGMLARLADMLDADPQAVVAYGDFEEFGQVNLVRAAPEWVDPFRLAYTNEYPQTALYRRSMLEAVGGWDEYRHDGRANYEDWSLWMEIAQRGQRGVHAGAGSVTYRQRVHGERLLEAAKSNHRALYRRLRRTHAPLFERVREHRRRSDMSGIRKTLYPLVYGARPRFPFEQRLKDGLDRVGVWTQRR